MSFIQNVLFGVLLDVSFPQLQYLQFCVYVSMEYLIKLLFSLVTFLVQISQGQRWTKPPHIVFIVADDLGWNDVGWHNPDMITPNLDALARRGVILDSVYAQPSCTPSRNAFMTGMFPFHTELQEVIDPSEPMFIPLKYTILPEHLKSLGYSTHMVGKWHLGFCNEKYTPTQRGFDSFFGFYGGSQCHYTHLKADKLVHALSNDMSLASFGRNLLKSVVNFRSVGHTVGRDFRFNDTAWTESEGQYSTHAFARRAIDVIRLHNRDDPLFLYLPFQAPHTPITVPLKYQKLYSHIHSKLRQTYSGMVSAIDEAVGNITDALYQYNYMDNLLLVFTSDNGASPYNGGSNTPLRGGKNTRWEGGTRVPTFVYSDTLLRRRGYINNEIIHAVDWYPTFVNIAGGRRVPDIDGVNQWPTISRGRYSSRYEFVYNLEPCGRGALRIGNYKLIVGKPGRHNDWYPVPGTKRIRRNRYKGGRFDQVRLKSSSYLLYNIRADPEERRDLSYRYPRILHAMLHRYRDLNATKVAPVLMERDSWADPQLHGGFWSPGWC